LHFSRKRQDESRPNFFRSLGENTCSLLPALKSNAPGLMINEARDLLYYYRRK